MRNVLLAFSFMLTVPLTPSSASAREMVGWQGDEDPGTVVVETEERGLYYVLGEGRALRYDIAVGKPGRQWFGATRVVGKAYWPRWTPTGSMRRRNPRLPLAMAGGLRNPLGSRAIYLADGTLRIHGTNEPGSIGKAASSGCFRMRNEDVEHLFDFVGDGTAVLVRR